MPKLSFGVNGAPQNFFRRAYNDLKLMMMSPMRTTAGKCFLISKRDICLQSHVELEIAFLLYGIIAVIGVYAFVCPCSSSRGQILVT